jgi:hypothetical protein
MLARLHNIYQNIFYMIYKITLAYLRRDAMFGGIEHKLNNETHTTFFSIIKDRPALCQPDGMFGSSPHTHEKSNFLTAKYAYLDFTDISTGKCSDQNFLILYTQGASVPTTSSDCFFHPFQV